MREELFIDGPAGRLEAVFEAGGAPPWPVAAVVCHPHPLHGGTMDNTVVHRLARGLRHCGGATLRFNFRGVGRSAGVHAEGEGEREDVRSALAALLERGPLERLAIMGFSFGARIGLEVGVEDARVEILVGAGLPLSLMSFEFLAECRKPKLLLQGQQDEFGEEELFRRFAQGLPEPKEIRVIAAADHLFRRRAQEVEHLVATYFGELTGPG